MVPNINHPLAKKEFIKPEELFKISLLLRESGSVTLEVIAHALKPLGIKIAKLQKKCSWVAQKV